jgi:hypothetical protein
MTNNTCVFTDVMGVSEAGSSSVPNQDRWGHTEDAIWVIDGATNLDKIAVSPCGDDGEWIATALNDILLAVDWNQYSSIADILQMAILSLRHQYLEWMNDAAQKPSTYPSAAIAIVRRLDDSKLEYLVLGDCSITITNKTERYFTNRDIMDLDAVAISELATLMKSGLSFTEARAGISETLTKNRNLMNTTGGYWIVSLDPTSPAHAKQGVIEDADEAEIILASDGFSRFWDLFEMGVQGQDSYTKIKDVGLLQSLNLLRRTEQDDADMIKYPRFKVSDDASVVICKFVETPGW